MTSFFVVPTFTPPTLEQLTSEPDEVALIVQQEARIHQDLTEVRDYNRSVQPLGVIAAQEELESEADDDEALASDEDLTDEEAGDELDDGSEGDLDEGDGVDEI